MRTVLEGITRSTGTRPRQQAAAATPDPLRQLLVTRPAAATPLGARDRALLLLGFGTALRRDELVGLTLGDVVAVVGKGLQVALWANPAEPFCCPLAACRPE